MRVTAILLAASRGSRFKSRISKPLVKLGGRPIIDFSLNVLNRHPRISDIILVVNSGNIKPIEDLVNRSGYKKVVFLVLGGARRQDSVFNALRKVDPRSRLVLIHDSARPFVRSREISALIARAGCCQAAILGVPVKATIKQVTSGFVVKRTLDRNFLWEIQTPQVFSRELLLKAYRRFKDADVTDDSGMVEKSNRRVELVKGSYDNIKITTPEDLPVAEALLRPKKDRRSWKK
jgi:2-C-methyl-D-erythritol 4-phosphate cytidylyltransferase